MLKTSKDERGFPVLETYTFERPIETFEILQEFDEKIEPFHQLTDSISIEKIDGSWTALDKSGEMFLLTENALTQLIGRMKSPKDVRITYFPIVETTVGKVAIAALSDSYALIPFSSINDSIQRVVQKYSGTHDFGRIAKVEISPSTVKMDYVLKTAEVGGDDIQLGWYWKSAHDGSSSLSFGYKAVRLICTNGLVLPLENETIIRTNHRWSGLGKSYMFALKNKINSSKIIDLPDKYRAFLTTGSVTVLSSRLFERIYKNILAVIKQTETVEEAARHASELRLYDFEHASKVLENLFLLITDESKNKELNKRYGMSQSAFSKLKSRYNRRSLFTLFRKNVQRYALELQNGYTMWTIVQSLTDRESLAKYPISLQDSFEQLGGRILLNSLQMRR